MVGGIGIAAACHGVFLVQRGHKGQIPAMKQALRQGLRPGVLSGADTEDLLGVAQHVLIKVAAADAVITLFVFALHVTEQHFHLIQGNGAVGGVGRQVHGVEHQLLPVFHGDAADGVAPIQIHQLHNALLNGQAAAQGGGDGRRGEGHQAGNGGAVGLRQRPEQEGGVVVLPPDGAEVRQRLPQQGGFIAVIAAGGAGVHLLHKVEIGVLLLQHLRNVGEVGVQPLLRPRPGLRAAVHEEAVIRLIGAEADVIGHHGVGGVRADGSGGAALRRKGEVVLDAVVGEEHIGHIGQNHEQQSQQHNAGDLQCFFHTVLLRWG